MDLDGVRRFRAVLGGPLARASEIVASAAVTAAPWDLASAGALPARRTHPEPEVELGPWVLPGSAEDFDDDADDEEDW